MWLWLLNRFIYKADRKAKGAQFVLQTAYGDGRCLFRSVAYGLNAAGLDRFDFDTKETPNPNQTKVAQLLLAGARDDDTQTDTDEDIQTDADAEAVAGHGQRREEMLCSLYQSLADIEGEHKVIFAQQLCIGFVL